MGACQNTAGPAVLHEPYHEDHPVGGPQVADSAAEYQRTTVGADPEQQPSPDFAAEAADDVQTFASRVGARSHSRG